MSGRPWFGLNPELRKPGFHTPKGQYALGSIGGAADRAAAVATDVARKAAGIRLGRPGLAFPAMRRLWAPITPNIRVFERSCGMSTFWFERRRGEVRAGEDDTAWYKDHLAPNRESKRLSARRPGARRKDPGASAWRLRSDLG